MRCGRQESNRMRQDSSASAPSEKGEGGAPPLSAPNARLVASRSSGDVPSAKGEARVRLQEPRVRGWWQADRQQAPRVRGGRRNLDHIRRNPSAGAPSARAAPRFSTIGPAAVSRNRRSALRGFKGEGRDSPAGRALGSPPDGFRRKGSRFRSLGTHSGHLLQASSHSVRLLQTSPHSVFLLLGLAGKCQGLAPMFTLGVPLVGVFAVEGFKRCPVRSRALPGYQATRAAAMSCLASS